MPNIKSAEKRVLVNQKKQQINRAVLSEVKTAIKKFNNAIDTNKIDEAEALLPAAFSVIDSAVTKGVLHKNNASNKKSALSKRLYNVKSGKVTIVIKKDNKTIAAEKAKAAKEAREAVRAENAKKAAERAAIKEAEGGKKKLTAKEAKKAEAKANDKATAKAEKTTKKKVDKVSEDKPAAETAQEPAKTEKAEKSAKKPAAAKKTKKPE